MGNNSSRSRSQNLSFLGLLLSLLCKASVFDILDGLLSASEFGAMLLLEFGETFTEFLTFLPPCSVPLLHALYSTVPTVVTKMFKLATVTTVVTKMPWLEHLYHDSGADGVLYVRVVFYASRPVTAVLHATAGFVVLTSFSFRGPPGRLLFLWRSGALLVPGAAR